MRRVALAFALSLTACPGGDVCTTTGATPQTASFGLAGQSTTVSMLLTVTCGSRVPTGVTVSVVGPDDKNVAVDAGMPSSSSDGFTTAVTFTPPTPGGYHIAARFEPSLGTTQYDLLAADDRRDAGLGAFTISEGKLLTCTHVEVTALGRLVCIGDGVQIYDSASATPTQLDGTAEYADGVIWVLQSGQLTRYVESDAGFVARESGPASSGKLLPTANDVVLASARMIPLPDGGLGAVTLDTTTSGAPQWRDQNVATRLNTFTFITACSVPLDGGTAPPCETLTGFTGGISPFGIDVNGFWVTDSSAVGKFAYLITPDGVASLKLPSDWSIGGVASPIWEQAPTVTGPDTYVLNGNLGLEAYLNSGESLLQACSRFVVVSNGTTARVVPRP